jgi:hypothetical protein
MAQKSTTRPAKKAKTARDLPLKSDTMATVKGGKASQVLAQAVSSGKHFKKAIVE